MPVDPMTGQMIPYGSGAQDTPLAMRLMEDMPGAAALAGFGANRGANTILRGGFMDDSRIFADRRADRYRVFSGSAQSSVSPNQYIGSSARRQRMAAANRQNFFRSSRVNNLTMRPRAFGRFHSLSVFGGVGFDGARTTGAYTPFMGSQFLNKIPGLVNFTGTNKAVAAGEAAFGPGLLSFITAGRRADRIERRALNGKSGAIGRLRTSRAIGKLSAIDTNIQRLATMNNIGVTTSATEAVGSLGASRRVATGQSININGKIYGPGQFLPNSYKPVATPTAPFQVARNSMVTGAGKGTVGVRGNLLASSMAGGGTRYMAGYFRGAMGFADVAGLEGKALEGAQRAVSMFDEALKAKGFAGPAISAQRALEQGIFKSGTQSALLTRQGAMVGAARFGAMAMPGLNVLATASLAYDLGKMGGEIVKSGINLARDAAKSVQGSIYKPLFGMGYVDTEAAATSRSRGVMAIQNSRLNARSMLGSEAGMMAARYG
jgi:hypothetical protein